MSIFRKFLLLIFLFLNVNSSNVFPMEEEDGLEILDQEVTRYNDDQGNLQGECFGDLCDSIFNEPAVNPDEDWVENEDWIGPKEETFECPFSTCGFKADEKDLLDLHTFNWHKCICQKNNQDELFFCHIDGQYGTPSEEDFVTYSESKGENPQNPIKKKFFKCSGKGCREAFFLRSELVEHLKDTHEKSFFCYFKGCFKAFCTRHNLNEHTRSSHSEENPYRCPDCKKSFAYSYGLRVHCKDKCPVTHPRLQKPFVCLKSCGKSFSGEPYLKKHLETCKG